MVIEIRDLEVKQSFLTAKKYEKKYGKSVDDILLDIIYNSDDVHAVLEGIKLFYSITISSDLTIDEIEEGLEPGQLIPFKRESDDNS